MGRDTAIGHRLVRYPYGVGELLGRLVGLLLGLLFGPPLFGLFAACGPRLSGRAHGVLVQLARLSVQLVRLVDLPLLLFVHLRLVGLRPLLFIHHATLLSSLVSVQDAYLVAGDTTTPFAPS
jgi:hypothetical protein